MGNKDTTPNKRTVDNAVFHEAEDRKETFKKGGKACKKGGKVMSEAHEGKRPARASGGGVFSSAASGTPRGKAQHY